MSGDLHSQMSRRVIDEVSALVERGRPVALLDYPNHVNAGDAAIWAGERVMLRRLGVPVRYLADQRSYRPDHLRALHPAGPILLHGGGNFGDLYPKHQRLRERVLEDFPDRHVIQLPQTVTFDDPAALSAVSGRTRAHPRFTLMVRDERSRDRYASMLADDVRLCPDSANCLVVRSSSERRGILWLARSDFERRGGAPDVPDDVIRTDWPGDPPAWHRRRLASRAMSALLSVDATRVAARLAQPITPVMFDRLAGERVMSAARQLGSASVVITDRLHGHIMSLVCGLPSVVLDNRTGKVGDYFRTWSADAEDVTWADSIAEAVEAARALVRA